MNDVKEILILMAGITSIFLMFIMGLSLIMPSTHSSQPPIKPSSNCEGKQP